MKKYEEVTSKEKVRQKREKPLSIAEICSEKPESFFLLTNEEHSEKLKSLPSEPSESCKSSQSTFFKWFGPKVYIPAGCKMEESFFGKKVERDRYPEYQNKFSYRQKQPKKEQVQDSVLEQIKQEEYLSYSEELEKTPVEECLEKLTNEQIQENLKKLERFENFASELIQGSAIEHEQKKRRFK